MLIPCYKGILVGFVGDLGTLSFRKLILHSQSTSNSSHLERKVQKLSVLAINTGLESKYNVVPIPALSSDTLSF